MGLALDSARGELQKRPEAEGSLSHMFENSPTDGPEIAFQKHLASGRFMLQRGVNSGCWVYYPRAVAPLTGEDLEWVEASGLGTVYSTTVVRKLVSFFFFFFPFFGFYDDSRKMSRV